MQVLVCPDKFRGSLTSAEACEAIRLGLSDAGVTDVVAVPMADGGEGTLDALLAAEGGERRVTDTVDALGHPVRADWGLLPDGTAVVEAATSMGLAMLGGNVDPMAASSAGLGIVIADAISHAPKRLLVTVGGVATTDGGLGCLDVLGWDLHGIETVVASDVTTRFVDAARTFAPQKGADAAQVVRLTHRLSDLAERYAREARDVADLPGSGAAGGIAGGLAAIGATLRPGFELVAELVGLDERMTNSDAVITGEGRLDATSLEGKVVGEVLRRRGTRTAAVLCGAADPLVAEQLRSDGVVVVSLRELATDDADSFARAAELLRTAASRVRVSGGYTPGSP